MSQITSESRTAVVVTSISGPNAILTALAEGCREIGRKFVVVGDRRSPADFALEGCEFLNIEDQKRLPFDYARVCPENSYARKNIGYLQAIAAGQEWVIETDDDNLPLEGFWRTRQRNVAGEILSGEGWQNVYRFFTGQFVYPRGYPLDLAKDSCMGGGGLPAEADCPVQQGLADGQPDVDAVFRLLHDTPITFSERSPMILDKGVWCPFNSQNTAFHKVAFPLLYLPAYCSFRATDIWRGFVAQRLLWTCDWRLSFHAPDVEQIRNPHDLLKDLEQEVPVYLQTRRLTEELNALPLAMGCENLIPNLQLCYEKLAQLGFVGPQEPGLLAVWVKDLQALA